MVPPERLGLPTSAFGDVDALLVPNGAPWLAHAVEYKRILMPARTFQTLLPNKLQELSKVSPKRISLPRPASPSSGSRCLCWWIVVNSPPLPEDTLQPLDR